VVVGAGYVGLATAVFLAGHGHRVTVLEKSRCTLDSLRQGRLHFREPLLQRMLRRVLKNGNLELHYPSPEAYRQAKFVFVAIDSVDRKSGKMRQASFRQMAEWIAGFDAKGPVTVVLKSTNVICFAEKFHKLLMRTAVRRIGLVVNPEFLREGYAYEDTAQPWRIIIGAHEHKDAAALLRLYRSIYPKTIPVVVTDWKSAELIKLAANVYLAYRLAFIHEITDFARGESLGIAAIKEGIGLDPRIGLHYFEPGLGFGGSCLPKDCQLINSPETRTRYTFSTARTALEINDRVLDSIITRLRQRLGRLKGKKIAILGAAFKPDIDDTRGSQAVKLALKLRRRGARVAVFDPYLTAAEKISEGQLPLEECLEDAVRSAWAVVIGTAHRQFRRIDAGQVARLVKKKTVCDDFGALNRSTWEKKGFVYI
jgi:UDPglucose 6-dehydrogenase